MWRVTRNSLEDIKEPILIEGLPGIGNVGKIVVDYLIDEYKAKKVASFFSYTLPNSSFVTEDNMVELPKIEIYCKEINGQCFLFLTGDVQPVTEEGSYTFTETILDIMQESKCKEIITLGGIGLSQQPKDPKVYCTGNHTEIVEKLKDAGASNDIYGVVGPIIGVTGLLLGLGKERRIQSGALLTETYAHPMYLGLKEAKNTLMILTKLYSFGINYEELDKEIDLMEKELSGEPVQRKSSKLQRITKFKDVTYIG